MAEPLNCEQLEIRLNELLDLRRTPDNDPQIGAHIEFCPECNELVRSHGLVQQYLEDSKSSLDDMDVDVSNSVVNNWAHLFPDPKTPAWRASSIVLVVCLLVILPAGLIWVAWPPAQQKDELAHHEVATARTDPDDVPKNETPTIDLTSSLQQIMGQAGNQLEWLNAYRPTMQLFGVSTVIDSLDLTIDMLRDRMPGQDHPESKGKSDSSSESKSGHPAEQKSDTGESHSDISTNG